MWSPFFRGYILFFIVSFHCFYNKWCLRKTHTLIRMRTMHTTCSIVYIFGCNSISSTVCGFVIIKSYTLSPFTSHGLYIILCIEFIEMMPMSILYRILVYKRPSINFIDEILWSFVDVNISIDYQCVECVVFAYLVDFVV